MSAVRWVPSKNWTRKKSARHLTIAKARKAARAEKAWKSRSKSK